MKPFEEQNFYELLEISPSANDDQLLAAYMRAEEVYAPDSVALYALEDPRRVESLRARLKQAFDVLSDPARRAEYDALLAKGEAPPPPEPPRAFVSSVGSGPVVAEPPREAPAPVAAAPEPVPVVEADDSFRFPSLSAYLAPPRQPVESHAASEPTPPAVDEDEFEPPRPPWARRSEDDRPRASMELVNGVNPEDLRRDTLPEGIPAIALPSSDAPAREATAVQEAEPAHARVADPGQEAKGAQAPDSDSAHAAQDAEATLVREEESAEPVRRLEDIPAPPPPVSREHSRTELVADVGPVTVTPRPASQPIPLPTRRGGRQLENAPQLASDSAIPLAESALAQVAGKVREARGEPRPPRFDVPADAEFNGELLRQIRKSRGLNLQQLADRTRISLKHLENIEADRYDALPTTVYLRGFLTSISREFGLDAIRVSKSYLGLVARHKGSQ